MIDNKNYTEATFQAALARARAREAAEIQAAINGQQKQTTCPIGLIDRSIRDNMVVAFNAMH